MNRRLGLIDSLAGYPPDALKKWLEARIPVLPIQWQGFLDGFQ